MALSASSSSAMPTLGTPGSGYLESPFMASSSLNTSPMIDGALDSAIDFNEFHTPLFPADGSDLFDHAMPDLTADNTASANSTHLSSPSPIVRNKSSPGRGPLSTPAPRRKRSTVAGVRPVKARKPLDPIIVAQDDDKETAKRKKNTAAARKSRQRKQESQEALEAEIQRLRGVVLRLGGDPDDEDSDSAQV